MQRLDAECFGTEWLGTEWLVTEWPSRSPGFDFCSRLPQRGHALAPHALEQIALDADHFVVRRGHRAAFFQQPCRSTVQPVQARAQRLRLVVGERRGALGETFVERAGPEAVELQQHLAWLAGRQGHAQPFLVRAQVLGQRGAAQRVIGQRAALLFEQVDGGVECGDGGGRIAFGLRNQAAASEAAYLHGKLLLHLCARQCRLESGAGLRQPPGAHQGLRAHHFGPRTTVGLPGCGKAGDGLIRQGQCGIGGAAGQCQLGARQRDGRAADAVVVRDEQGGGLRE